MRTDFYNMENNFVMIGETIEKVFIYGNGVVLAELEEIQEHEIKNGIISSVYDGTATKVFLDSEIKKSVKLNLDRTDNFYIKNPEKRYAMDKPYNLYIYYKNVDFKNSGEVLAAQFDHEKNFLQSYEVTFPKVEFKRHKTEKIATNENYKLQEGEQFSESCYGRDIDHKCVWYYDNSESIFYKKNHPELASEKGIIKRWFENEQKENCKMLLTRRCYVRTEYDDFRKNSNILADKFERILNKSISHYDIEKLLAHFKIIEK